MTANTNITPVELVEQIFVDMGIGPTEAMSMAGAFTTRAADAGLSLGNAAAVPPSGHAEPGRPVWDRRTASGEKTPMVSALDGDVLVDGLDPDNALSPEAAELFARHLRAAATEARAQRAVRTITRTEEEL